ncbi:hypothetical protein CMO92_00765 [Candidatus Woesearchaeota archaeon]|nr:hypothetical protein [Candidatus Woesearchaeota archaeon]|tara:strand:- start:593 stop:832 length:240 start_codon:yes stop_codon:yes gene_type:complete
MDGFSEGKLLKLGGGCGWMAEKGKFFQVRFVLGDQIQTHIQGKDVAPLEAIGLLEMAKDQILGNLRKGTKNVFHVEKKE